MRLPCACHAPAMRLRCACDAPATRLRCACDAPAMRLPRARHAPAMRCSDLGTHQKRGLFGQAGAFSMRRFFFRPNHRLVSFILRVRRRPAGETMPFLQRVTLQVLLECTPVPQLASFVPWKGDARRARDVDFWPAGVCFPRASRGCHWSKPGARQSSDHGRNSGGFREVRRPLAAAYFADEADKSVLGFG